MNLIKSVLKKVSLSVINDLVTDNRVHKIASSLKKFGFEPVLIGRLLPESVPVVREYETHRLELIARKGPSFYFFFNIRLLIYLLKSKIDIFVANDLDTLPANFIASAIKRKPLIYDSHEYFTEVPELIGRPFIKGIWQFIEKLLVPRVDAAYTVCDSIAEIYTELYKKDFKVVRNLPARVENSDIKEEEIENSSDRKIIIYQGALNLGRGIESAIRAMIYVEKAELWLVGEGDFSEKLRELVLQLKLTEKVKFLGRIPISELPEITNQASLGLSLEEDMGLNYRYALPNKLFDYIQAEIPVLVSNLPEMSRIVKKYDIGLVADSHQRKELAGLINIALFDNEKRKVWKNNLKISSNTLCWENEEILLYNIYLPFV